MQKQKIQTTQNNLVRKFLMLEKYCHRELCFLHAGFLGLPLARKVYIKQFQRSLSIYESYTVYTRYTSSFFTSLSELLKPDTNLFCHSHKSDKRQLLIQCSFMVLNVKLYHFSCFLKKKTCCSWEKKLTKIICRHSREFLEIFTFTELVKYLNRCK